MTATAKPSVDKTLSEAQYISLFFFAGTDEEDGTLVCAVMDVTSRFVATSCSDKTIAIVDLTTGNIVANMAGSFVIFDYSLL